MSEQSLYETLHSYFPFGFHLSRKSWERYDILSLLDDYNPDKPTSGIYAIRRLAYRINKKNIHRTRYKEPVQTGQLVSIGIIIDILRYIIFTYCREEVPGVIPQSHKWTAKQFGQAIIEKPPPVFVNQFPPLPVMKSHQIEAEYLKDTSETLSNRDNITVEMILLSLAAVNPAFKPFLDLFDDTALKQQSPYRPYVKNIENYFNTQPDFSPLGIKLFECLRAPMLASPDSLEGQLIYIRDRWAKFLPLELLKELLLAADILREEQQLRGLGPGQIRVLRFGKDAYGYDFDYPEPARFSRDADWMSNVVILAKSTYIWLDQLSKKYKRDIRNLNDIPDEELDRLARWGFTGLWLIGLWERSSVSQKIKQYMGNPEAAASAYSLYDYIIAEDLGGETAFQNLRDRAWQRGIRLASDMVPNHVGIFSKWVVEHPDWFVQNDIPPYPWYRFSGEDLSPDQRVGIIIEDGYWEHRDAAVVFKRVDKFTGDVRYIYHGNDGTSMPWNDTAQLNFLLPEVREAVIQTILHVARKCPIIRFDAAMTLAKKHYQRLWFPKHGDGGAIPSRAEYGMTKEEFEAVFPKEFWREVVDRIASETPDTLLLAEAFWLMEGYFVRTLGMHRVYNSAFMNMLKMEDNGKYRKTVKNVLEFSPEVLKRFVNFMNNPDEDTAAAQFGKGDKYYGVAVLMVTMPGLPMFGHGQIEGFTEKYGMEYRRAYWDEQVDEEMVRRHEREIFPLMRRRNLFSGADNFAFYDFNSSDGGVDENVFAYTNRAGDERAIIIYNNAFNNTRGWIKVSTPINIGKGEEKILKSKTVAEALTLNADEGYLYVFRDYKAGLDYIRSGKQIAKEGIYAELQAYQYIAFLDFREIFDSDGTWSSLARKLNGDGAPNIDDAYREMLFEPILIPFNKTLNADILHQITSDCDKARPHIEKNILRFLNAVKDFTGADISADEIYKDIINELKTIPIDRNLDSSKFDADIVSGFLSKVDMINAQSLTHITFAWIIIHHLWRFDLQDEAETALVSSSAPLENWMLNTYIYRAFNDFSHNETYAYFDSLLVNIITVYEKLFIANHSKTITEMINDIFENKTAQEYLQFNMHDNFLYLNKEQLGRMVNALLFAAIVHLRANDKLTNDILRYALTKAKQILDAANGAGYRVEDIKRLLIK
ncbi:MAG: alpha-amylase [candidate division Zixibacteria bacterium]|nr:alpha-amylase [candidate division Zixibacteria bacterium]